MYIKNFDQWNDKKKSLDENPGNNFYFSEREIWWASLGVNIGREIDGKDEDYARPVLIIRKFSTDTLWIIPMTSSIKSGTYFHTIKIGNGMRTLVLLQLKMISSKRLLRGLHKIERDELNIIIGKIKTLLPP
jgi:mRNA interferase MazF